MYYSSGSNSRYRRRVHRTKRFNTLTIDKLDEKAKLSKDSDAKLKGLKLVSSKGSQLPKREITHQFASR